MPELRMNGEKDFEIDFLAGNWKIAEFLAELQVAIDGMNTLKEGLENLKIEKEYQRIKKIKGKK